MIAFFIDGPKPRRTMELHGRPPPFLYTYNELERKLTPLTLDLDEIWEPTMPETRYRFFVGIGERVYYTNEPTDDAAWDNLIGLMKEDMDQDRRAVAAGVR